MNLAIGPATEPFDDVEITRAEEFDPGQPAVFALGLELTFGTGRDGSSLLEVGVAAVEVR